MVEETEKKKEETHLGENLKKLSAISQWLESQEQSDEPDFEQGLARVKEAAKLIKASRDRLATIKNEFEEITEKIEEEEDREKE